MYDCVGYMHITRKTSFIYQSCLYLQIIFNKFMINKVGNLAAYGRWMTCFDTIQNKQDTATDRFRSFLSSCFEFVNFGNYTKRKQHWVVSETFGNFDHYHYSYIINNNHCNDAFFFVLVCFKTNNGIKEN